MPTGHATGAVLPDGQKCPAGQHDELKAPHSLVVMLLTDSQLGFLASAAVPKYPAEHGLQP